jgi:hypothetical protein
MNSNARIQFRRLQIQLLEVVLRPEVWQVHLPNGSAWIHWVDAGRRGWEIHQAGTTDIEFVEGPREVTSSLVVTRLISKGYDEKELEALVEQKTAAADALAIIKIRDAAASSARDLLIRRLQCSMFSRIDVCQDASSKALLEDILRELLEFSHLDPLGELHFDADAAITASASTD